MPALPNTRQSNTPPGTNSIAGKAGKGLPRPIGPCHRPCLPPPRPCCCRRTMAGLYPFFFHRWAYLVHVVVLPAPAAAVMVATRWAQQSQKVLAGMRGCACVDGCRWQPCQHPQHPQQPCGRQAARAAQPPTHPPTRTHTRTHTHHPTTHCSGVVFGGWPCRPTITPTAHSACPPTHKQEHQRASGSPCPPVHVTITCDHQKQRLGRLTLPAHTFVHHI